MLPLGVKFLMLATLLAGAAAAAGTAWGRYRNLPPILTSIAALLASLYLIGDIHRDLSRPPPTESSAPARAPEPPARPRQAVVEQFTMRSVNFIPVGKVNCLEAGRQAEWHADDPERMGELLEITVHICRQVPGKDRVVLERLAGAYVALGAQVDRAKACQHYRRARALFAELSRPGHVGRVDLLRAADGCP